MESGKVDKPIELLSSSATPPPHFRNEGGMHEFGLALTQVTSSSDLNVRWAYHGNLRFTKLEITIVFKL